MCGKAISMMLHLKESLSIQSNGQANGHANGKTKTQSVGKKYTGE
jgi:hypothetical protein